MEESDLAVKYLGAPLIAQCSTMFPPARPHHNFGSEVERRPALGWRDAGGRRHPCHPTCRLQHDDDDEEDAAGRKPPDNLDIFLGKLLLQESPGGVDAVESVARWLEAVDVLGGAPRRRGQPTAAVAEGCPWTAAGAGRPYAAALDSCLGDVWQLR